MQMNQSDAIRFCNSKSSTLAIVRNSCTLNYLIGLANNNVKIWVFWNTFEVYIIYF